VQQTSATATRRFVQPVAELTLLEGERDEMDALDEWMGKVYSLLMAMRDASSTQMTPCPCMDI
jgi:hypothetical protein